MMLQLVSVKVKANELTCEDILSKCDLAVKAQQTALTEQNQLLELLRKQRNEAIKESVENKSFMPAFVWVLIGAAGGVLAMEFAR